ncbi:acyl-CoA dehydrogenase [Mycolicibacterium moriokaense]|nr:acyl-CoA dehydrogenase [Mycolicibacterium moriokaense]
MSADERSVDDSWNMVEESIFHVLGSAAEEDSGGHVRLGSRLAELGWTDIESEYRFEAAELLFRARARTLIHSDCLDRLMIAELSPVLGGAADAVVLPGIATAGRPPVGTEVSGIVVGPPRGRLVFATARPDGTVHIGVVDAASLNCQPMNTFDATCQWTDVSGVAPGPLTDASPHWTNAVAVARCALGTELVELGTAAIDLAVDHVSRRTQFGSPIGTFQSPRHTLAQAHACLEGARALVDAARRDGGELSALIGKAAAGRAHRSAADAAMQVCGAIGLTIEHDLHRYVARGMQLDALLGSYRQLEAVLADRLLQPAASDAPLPRVIACG